MKLALVCLLIPTALFAQESPTKYETNPNSGNFQIRANPGPDQRYREGSFSQPWREYHHDIGGESRCKRDPDCNPQGPAREPHPDWHHKSPASKQN